MAYSRTFSETVSYPRRVVKQYGSGAPYNAEQFENMVTMAGSRSGEKVPDWKEKIRLGVQAGSPFTSDRTKCKSREAGSNTLVYYYVGAPSALYKQTLEGYYPAGGPPSVSHLTGTSLASADAAALAAIYKKMNAGLSQMNAPAAILEFGSVVRQFGSPFRSIVNLTNKHLARVKARTERVNLKTRKGQEDWLNIAATSYLEYAFGLVPLISDTKSAAEALGRWEYEMLEESRFRSKVTGRGVSEKATVSSTTDTFSNCLYRGLNTLRQTTQERVQYVAGLSPSLVADFGTNDRLKQLLGFRPESWIPAIWEAVPWSWLIDYFTNVQKILQSLEASVIKPSWVVKTVSTVTTQERLVTVLPKQTRTAVEQGGIFVVTRLDEGLIEKVVVVRTTVVRTLPTALSLPSLEFSLPTDIRQTVNMAAVLVTLKPKRVSLTPMI